MAHLTDSELIVLKARALAAQVSSAHLAHAEAHIMTLVDEVLALRGGKKVALKEMVKPSTVAVTEEVKASVVSVKTEHSVEEIAEQLNDPSVDKVEAEVKAKKKGK